THIVWLNEEEFLATDGGRNINRWLWKAGENQFRVVPSQENDSDPTLRMAANISTAAMALAPEAGGRVRAVVACDDKTIYLIEGRNAEALKTGQKGLTVSEQQWKPKGRVTARPFFLDKDVLVIADRNRLLRFRMGKADPVWE